jgi:hypothetical protein
MIGSGSLIVGFLIRLIPETSWQFEVFKDSARLDKKHSHKHLDSSTIIMADPRIVRSTLISQNSLKNVLK